MWVGDESGLLDSGGHPCGDEFHIMRGDDDREAVEVLVAGLGQR